MRYTFPLLLLLLIFTSCKKNNARVGNDDWNEFYELANKQCGVTWHDTFYTSYPSAHPLASVFSHMHSGYNVGFSVPNKTSDNTFELSSKGLGFEEANTLLQFTVNGSTATADWNELYSITYFHDTVIVSITNASFEVTASILQINPLKIKFDIN